MRKLLFVALLVVGCGPVPEPKPAPKELDLSQALGQRIVSVEPKGTLVVLTLEGGNELHIKGHKHSLRLTLIEPTEAR
jgi:hypothetical protein